MVAKKSSIIIISALFITLTIGIFWGINKYFYDSLIKQNGEKGLVVLKNIENTLDKEEVQDIFGKQEHSNPYYIDMVNKFKQIERDNIEKYKRSLEPKKEKLERSDNPYKYRKSEDLNHCLVCNEHLFKEKYSLKKCRYCGRFYVNIGDSTRDEIMDIVKADPIFVMNIQRK